MDDLTTQQQMGFWEMPLLPIMGICAGDASVFIRPLCDVARDGRVCDWTSKVSQAKARKWVVPELRDRHGECVPAATLGMDAFPF